MMSCEMDHPPVANTAYGLACHGISHNVLNYDFNTTNSAPDAIKVQIKVKTCRQTVSGMGSSWVEVLFNFTF